MNIETITPYLNQIGLALFTAGCIYTTFKLTFRHHEKILDKHEKAIDKILDRLDHMSEDVNFIKGCIFGKKA